NHTSAATTDHAAAPAGGLRTAVRTIGTREKTTQVAYTANPATATHRAPRARPPAAVANPNRAGIRHLRAMAEVPSTILVRRIVGHNVKRLPSTARPTQPHRFMCTCAATRRWCVSGPVAPNSIVVPSKTPNTNETPAPVYQAPTWPKRPDKARREHVASRNVCTTTTPSTVSAPTTARWSGPATAQISSTAIPVSRTARRPAWHRSDVAGSRIRATVKCSVQVMIALVTAPSRNRCTGSHAGSPRRSEKAAANTARPAQSRTTTLALACHDLFLGRGGG